MKLNACGSCNCIPIWLASIHSRNVVSFGGFLRELDVDTQAALMSDTDCDAASDDDDASLVIVGCVMDCRDGNSTEFLCCRTRLVEVSLKQDFTDHSESGVGKSKKLRRAGAAQ